MTKSAMVRARMQPRLKARAEKVFDHLGLSPTQAITLFYRQVELRKGLPFGIRIPNRATREALDDAEAGRNLIVCRDMKEMFKKLGI
jgi:DNA-damage-inducible protein J